MLVALANYEGDDREVQRRRIKICSPEELGMFAEIDDTDGREVMEGRRAKETLSSTAVIFIAAIFACGVLLGLLVSIAARRI